MTPTKNQTLATAERRKTALYLENAQPRTSCMKPKYIATSSDEKTYIGLTATSFKTRHSSHKASFKHKEKRHQTELSKHIWTLKDEGTPYTITWRIIRHAQPYSPRTKRCNLCLWEKYHIITADKSTILNSRTELISTCRHKKKFILSEYG